MVEVEHLRGPTMSDALTEELVQLNRRLLESIATADWEMYQELCDPTLTAFEPESQGNLVEGMEFHHFYFRLSGHRGPRQTTLCSPHVRVMGDVAVVAYVRLDQGVSPDGTPVETAVQETRVWQRQAGRWRHVHFHRSKAPGGQPA
jgi:calcium/calmodulin-dependent protein kinase (CaM kinase) II